MAFGESDVVAWLVGVRFFVCYFCLPRCRLVCFFWLLCPGNVIACFQKKKKESVRFWVEELFYIIIIYY